MHDLQFHLQIAPSTRCARGHPPLCSVCTTLALRRPSHSISPASLAPSLLPQFTNATVFDLIIRTSGLDVFMTLNQVERLSDLLVAPSMLVVGDYLIITVL